MYKSTTFQTFPSVIRELHSAPGHCACLKECNIASIKWDEIKDSWYLVYFCFVPLQKKIHLHWWHIQGGTMHWHYIDTWSTLISNEFGYFRVQQELAYLFSKNSKQHYLHWMYANFSWLWYLCIEDNRYHKIASAFFFHFIPQVWLYQDPDTLRTRMYRIALTSTGYAPFWTYTFR